MNQKMISIRIKTHLFLALGLLGCLFPCTIPSPVSAEVGLQVNPSIITITAQYPQSVTTPIILENTTQETLSLSLSMQSFHPSDKHDGSIVYEWNTPQTASRTFFEHVSFMHEGKPIKEITLAPKQKREIELLMDIPTSLPKRDYYFSVLYTSKDIGSENIPPLSHDASNSRIISSIAQHVLVTFGTKKPEALIEQFRGPLFVEHGPVSFSLLIKNQGENSIYPSGTIHIDNMFGQTVGKIDLPVLPVLRNASRYIGTPTQTERMPTLYWKESFLLGFYTARLHVRISDVGPTFEQTVYFFAMPFQGMIIMGSTLILFIILFSRVKKRLRNTM